LTPKQQQSATARILGYQIVPMPSNYGGHVQVIDPDGYFVVYLIPGKEGRDPLSSNRVGEHMYEKYGINCNDYTPEDKKYDS